MRRIHEQEIRLVCCCFPRGRVEEIYLEYFCQDILTEVFKKKKLKKGC